MLAHASGRNVYEVVPVRAWPADDAWQSWLGIWSGALSGLGDKYSPVCGSCDFAKQHSGINSVLAAKRHFDFACTYRVLQTFRHDVS